MSTLTLPLSSKSQYLESILMHNSENFEPQELHNSVSKSLSENNNNACNSKEETIILNADDGASYQSFVGSLPQPLAVSLKDVIFLEPDNNIDSNQLYFLITPEENLTLNDFSSVIIPSCDGVDENFKGDPIIAVLDINTPSDNSFNADKVKQSQVLTNQNFNLNTNELKENLSFENIKVLNSEARVLQRNLLLPQQSHSIKRVSGRTITCDKCKLVFNSAIQYYSHRNIHIQAESGKIVWSCAQCGKECKSRDKLKSHELKEHGQVRLYPCPHCVHSFSKPLLLDYHINHVHHGEKQFKCQVCNQEFFRSYDLKRHLNIHFNIKQHLCQFCGKQFNHLSNLYRHQRSHTRVKPYLCKVCDRRFSHMSSLLVHKVSHKSGGYCSECKATFRSIPGLRNHMKTIHEKKMTTKELYNFFCKNTPKDVFRCYNCVICADRFRFKKELLKHEKLAHSSKAFPCKSCHKIFQDINELKSHACIIKQSKKGVKYKNIEELTFLDEYKCVVCNQILQHYKAAEKHDCPERYSKSLSKRIPENCQIEVTKEDFLEETLMLCINNEDNASISSLPRVANNDEEKSINHNLKSIVTWTLENKDLDKENNKTVSYLRQGTEGESLPFSDNITNSKKNEKKPPKILECKYCSKTFSRSWNWQQHTATHDASLRRYNCKECGETFSYRSTYTNHLKTHSKAELIEKFKCSQCPKVSAFQLFVQNN